MKTYKEIILAIVIGFFVGIVSVFLGVIGSLMLTLVLLTGLHEDFKLALGTTFLATISPVTLGGVYEFWRANKVDWVSAILLGISFFVGNMISAKFLIGRVHEETLYFAYGLFSLVTAYLFIRRSKFIKWLK